LVAIVITHPSESGRAEVSFILPLPAQGKGSQDLAFASIHARSGC
jgi:hypothetical protein